MTQTSLPRRPLAAGLLALASLLPSPSFAADASPWRYQGTFSGKGDYYENHGNPAISPYRFEDAHWLGNLDLSFERSLSPYESIRGQLTGRANASEYISDYRGGILDRFSTTWEKGDAGIPFRLTAGDYFAFLTPRTVQRSLKGLQLELQPQVRGGHRQSVVVFTGSAFPSFREVDYNHDVSSGLSFLVDEGERGAISFNVVTHHQEATPTQTSLNQVLSSVAVHRQEHHWGQNLTLDAEGALFDGTPAGTNAGPNTPGQGFFLRLQGNNGGPLHYSYHKEHFDEDFRPTGAPVVADRDADFLRASYRFSDGTRLELRDLIEVTGYSSSDPLKRITRGMNLNGPLLPGRIRGGRYALDSFRQRFRNRTLRTDTEAWVHNLSLTAPWRDWSLQLSQLFQDFDDHVNVAGDLVERSTRLAGTRAVRIADYRGTMNLGLNYRRQHALPGSRDWGASLGMNLAKGAHTLGFSLANYDQQRLVLPSRDTVLQDLKLRYGIHWGDQQISLETGWQVRAENQAANNTAFEVGVLYSVQFGSRERHATSAPATVVAPPAAESPDRQANDGFRLAALKPGISLTEARVLLARAGIGGSVQQAGVEVYEARCYERFSERQRLFLEAENGRLIRSGVLIDLGGAGTPMDQRDQLDRTLAMLIERYGPPQNTVEQGEVLATLRQDVDEGSLVRLYEWPLEGGTLRLGIPRRLDGNVRIEIQFAREHRSPRDPNWSLEQLP